MSCSPAPRAASTASVPKPLVTPTTRIRPGSPPARSMRARRAPSLDATSSLAQEGGDVEIVVAEVELFFLARGVGEDVHGFGRVEDRCHAVGTLGWRAFLPAFEAGGNDGDPDLVAHGVVDHRAEVDF